MTAARCRRGSPGPPPLAPSHSLALRMSLELRLGGPSVSATGKADEATTKMLSLSKRWSGGSRWPPHPPLVPPLVPPPVLASGEHSSPRRPVISFNSLTTSNCTAGKVVEEWGQDSVVGVWEHIASLNKCWAINYYLFPKAGAQGWMNLPRKAPGPVFLLSLAFIVIIIFCGKMRQRIR